MISFPLLCLIESLLDVTLKVYVFLQKVPWRNNLMTYISDHRSMIYWNILYSYVWIILSTYLSFNWKKSFYRKQRKIDLDFFTCFDKIDWYLYQNMLLLLLFLLFIKSINDSYRHRRLYISMSTDAFI